MSELKRKERIASLELKVARLEALVERLEKTIERLQQEAQRHITFNPKEPLTLTPGIVLSGCSGCEYGKLPCNCVGNTPTIVC